jgi:hypothetical protein
MYVGPATAPRTIGAHRLAYLFTYGVIQAGLCVLHRCDNPPCCNPAHLWLGTSQENINDMIRKDRLARGDRSGARLHPERLARGDRNGARLYPERLARGDRNSTRQHPERVRGELNGSAKLTASQVQEIRAVEGQVSKRELARQYGVSQRLIQHIHSRRLWKHLPEEESRG